MIQLSLFLYFLYVVKLKYFEGQIFFFCVYILYFNENKFILFPFSLRAVFEYRNLPLLIINPQMSTNINRQFYRTSSQPRLTDIPSVPYPFISVHDYLPTTLHQSIFSTLSYNPCSPSKKIELSIFSSTADEWQQLGVEVCQIINKLANLRWLFSNIFFLTKPIYNPY